MPLTAVDVHVHVGGNRDSCPQLQVGGYFAYNFVRIHRTLRMTPAMASGVTDRLWDVSDIVALLERAESKKSSVSPDLRQWARVVKRDVHALYLAAGDARVPWYAKAVAVAVAAYALSPIDLIPDFIPVLGYVDDVVIVPVGIMLAVRLVPPELMAEFRATVSRPDSPPTLGKVGAAIIVALWITGIIGAALLVRSYWG